ncbi:MAG: site-specific integrase [Catalinimonas sp.]
MRCLFLLRRNKRYPDRPATIYCRVTIDAVRSTNPFSTRIKVLSDRWDSRGQRIKGKTPVALSDNAALQRIRADLQDLFYRLTADGPHIHPDALQAAYLDRHTAATSLLLLCRRYLERNALDWSEPTRNVYDDYVVALERFLTDAGRKHLGPERFDHDTIDDFRRHLSRRCGQARAVKNIGFIFRVIRDAVDRGKLTDDPTRGYRLRKPAPKPIEALTREEVERIRAFDFPPRLDRVRDAFLFQCATGLAYAELHQVTPDRITAAGTRHWLTVIRGKTDTPYAVPLMSEARAVLDKYAGRLPVLSNKSYNQYLKEVAAFCGIRTHLTTHVARRTAATLWLNAGVPLTTVSRLLGHASTRTTQRHYARLLDETIAADLEAYEKATPRP